MTAPMSEQRLAEIETRAAYLYEIGGPKAAETQVLGTDVPQLIAEVRRLWAEEAAECEDCAAREASHEGTRRSLGTERNISENRARRLVAAENEIARLRAELAAKEA